MTDKFLPPLAIHFIWSVADTALVDPILNTVRISFARNIDWPFSRGLSLPLFFYSTINPTSCPVEQPSQRAQKDLVFIFTSVNTLGWDSWQEYINKVPNSSSFNVIPIALDKQGLGHGFDGNIKNINFIRSYEWNASTKEQQAILAIAHEIYRHGFTDYDDANPGRSSSLKIFLSHAKAGDTGRILAEAIRQYLANTNMSQFFDATDISPGFRFDEEIIKHLKESTVVAIGSDFYSSRYWCQREILCAKEHDRPIIAVDCLDQYEDRIFPAAANIPCVHISSSSPIDEVDILRILSAALIETLRFFHAKKSLEYYQQRGWIDADCEIIARPPEIRKIISIKKRGIEKICYPEPPIYIEEADWLDHFDIRTFTPLWSSDEINAFDSRRVGVSISDFPAHDYSEHHLHSDQLQRLSQDLARHLLARSATLIYGGDLREDGFTQFILDEAIALKSRLNSGNIYVENHLSWPLYISNTEMVAWRAKYNGVIKTVLHQVPADIIAGVDTTHFLRPDNTDNRYVWSRCLTQMRTESISVCHARICAGGKSSGYLGKMPGVLEEIVIAMQAKKPVYLLGGFGGIVSDVCNSIRNKVIESSLTEDWQASNNVGYFDLQNCAKKEGLHADYSALKTIIENLSLAELASQAGLDEEEYLCLMQSPFVDECVHLVVQGLKKIS